MICPRCKGKGKTINNEIFIPVLGLFIAMFEGAGKRCCVCEGKAVIKDPDKDD